MSLGPLTLEMEQARTAWMESDCDDDGLYEAYSTAVAQRNQQIAVLTRREFPIAFRLQETSWWALDRLCWLTDWTGRCYVLDSGLAQRVWRWGNQMIDQAILNPETL